MPETWSEVSKVVPGVTVVIGVVALTMGAWAFFHPAGFFADFPVRGAEWVSRLVTTTGT